MTGDERAGIERAPGHRATRARGGVAVRLVRAYPATLALLATLVAGALWTNTFARPLAADLRDRFGFAPLDLVHGRWLRLVSSAVVTAGGAWFYACATMLALSVGAAERAFGSLRALSLFWISHAVSSTLAASVIAGPLRWLAAQHSTLAWSAADVGPSGGYYACLGAACGALPRRTRRIVVAAILALLAARLAVSLATSSEAARTLSADLAHAIAFPLGLLASARLRRRSDGPPPTRLAALPPRSA